MTQHLLSGNAENVDWNDIAEAGRAYADNLLGEPAVSKIMHAMADEIERLRLTEDELAAIDEAWCAIGRSDDHSEFAKKRIRATLRGLLERLSGERN